MTPNAPFSVAQLSASSSVFTLTSPTSPGSYTVSVTASGTDGSTGLGHAAQLSGDHGGPAADGELPPSRGGPVASGPLGVAVKYAAQVTGGAGRVRYAWSVTLNGQPYPTSNPTNGPTFSLTPTQFGAYAITLTATDDAGGSATATDTFTAVPTIVYTGTTLNNDSTFTASFTTATPATGSFTYQWAVNGSIVQALGTPAVSVVVSPNVQTISGSP